MNFAENSEFFSREGVFSPFSDPKGSKFSPFTHAVCLFDSGLGGLSVLFKCREMLPSQKFIYYGDNDRAPYGNLPSGIISRYVFSAAEELASYSPEALVLACNTATACCADALRKKYAFPILGAYPPLLAGGKIGGDGLVLVTRATYESRAFASLAHRAEKLCPSAHFYPYPCDLLAAKIEDTLAAAPDAVYTAELPARKFSFVILGCTHYAHVREAIARFYDCPAIDGAEGLARRLAVTLAAKKSSQISPRNAAENVADENADPRVTTSDPETKNFADVSEKNVSSDGKVLFLGSGKEKNRTFYEHSFAGDLS